MAYCDVAYLQTVIDPQVLADIADHVNRPGNIADATTLANIDAAIKRADELIDSHLRTVYSGTLPTTTVPDVIQSCSADLTISYLWDGKTTIPEEWKEKREKWLKWLRDLAKGLVTVDLPGEASVGVHGVGYNKDYDDREFSPEEISKSF